MSRFSLFIALITITFLVSCNQETAINLKRNGDEKMTYYASKKYGYSMEIFKYIEGEYNQYVVRLNGNGEVMYIYKTRVSKDDEPIAVGPTWYLVSDTTDTLYGAKFFDRTILGYYSTETDFITSNNFKGTSSPYLNDEKKIFSEVAKLMKEKKQTFISFDTTRSLFWFKYNLQ